MSLFPSRQQRPSRARRSRALSALFLTIVALATGFSGSRALADVVINEIHYNPPDNTVRLEFVELYNNGEEPVALDGWRFDRGVEFTFPAGTTLAPGGYLVVAESPPTMQSVYNVAALGPWKGNLSSDGERLRLVDASGAVRDEVEYSPSFPWPISANGEGASMELINPSLDNSLGGNWRPSFIPPSTPNYKPGNAEASPGKVNRTFAENAPPAVWQVTHTPEKPLPSQPIVVTAKVADPDGVAEVELSYQIVTPGNFIPAYLPNPVTGGNINVNTPRAANPAFEDPASWTALPMRDDGTGGDLVAGDGVFTAIIPGQANRTLVRWRVQARDAKGLGQRWPFEDDAQKNFAAFVYAGVPDYEGIPAERLTTLPVYHFLTRKDDYRKCMAYDSTASRLNGGTPGYTFENWEGAFVYDGKVYDHIRYRLHGGNGRYDASGAPGAAPYGKRSLVFAFNKGSDFEARSQDGAPYPVKWRRIITQNLWENRGTLTFSLNEAVNYHLWNTVGIPAPFTHWAHLRLIVNEEEQPDAYNGDFWGLLFCQENYDGRFLDNHGMEKGNLYKLNRDDTLGRDQLRYQAPNGAKNGADHDWIHNNLRGSTPAATVAARVDVPRWSLYHAICQAVRHYDYWPSGDNNAAWYFYPNYTPQNQNHGQLWMLPWDVDATWGPTWNNGHDKVYNALFNASASVGGDSNTNPTLWPIYFNAVREVRDLLWRPDQIDPLIDYYANIIRPFVDADMKRWAGAPNAVGNYGTLKVAGTTITRNTVGAQALDRYVADMKKFAWTGGSWPGGSMGAGGSARFLDNLQGSQGEGGKIPRTPEITYTGAAGYPAGGLRFKSSAFSDPQPEDSFAGMEWRIAPVDDPASPPAGQRLPRLEWDASWSSGVLTTFTEEITPPASAVRAGQPYRARVRHMDSTGRWSHWSEPVTFTATLPDLSAYRENLVISQFLYDPAGPDAAGLAAGYEAASYEWIEIMNVGDVTLPLAGLRFTKGIDFDFPENGPVTEIQPGRRVLVVANRAAFESRYGSEGFVIAGEWGGEGGKLSNDGENLKLSYGAGESLREFVYSPSAPWPDTTGGKALVLVNPSARPDHSVAGSWRASQTPGGTPGRAEDDGGAGGVPFTGDPAADGDGDGLPALLEYAMGSSDSAAATDAPLTIASAGSGEGGVVFSFTRAENAVSAQLVVEWSTDLQTWRTDPGDGSVVQTIGEEDTGTPFVRRVTCRLTPPSGADGKIFIRLRATLLP